MENEAKPSAPSDHLLNPANKLQTPNQKPSEKQTVSPTNKWRKFRRIVSSYWLFELSCWTFALACLLAIVATLRTFDGQLVPAWRYGITLNTIVSLLASFATFALMVPVTAGLGQLKWLWFRRTRPLADFELIESSGRGPTGSTMLLLRGRGG